MVRERAKGGGDRAAAEDIARMRVVKFEGPPPAGGAPAARAGASLGERLLGELAPDELRAAGVSFTGGGGDRCLHHLPRLHHPLEYDYCGE